METSDVRRRVSETIEKSKRLAAERRVRADEASTEWATFLDRTAVPLFRQVANILKTEGYSFTVFTPSHSARLMSDKSADDYIELLLDTTASEIVVLGRTSRRWGGRVIESERAIAAGPVREIGEDAVLDFLTTELAPFVER